MKGTLGRATVCVLATAGLVLTTAGAAAAHPARHHRAHRAKAAAARMAAIHYLENDKPLMQRVPGRASAAGSVSSYNWSGYADVSSTSGEFSEVAGTWKVPKLTCPTDEFQVAVQWVGIDGYSDSTVEQDGTLTECFEGAAYYYTWWEMYPTNSIQLATDSVAGDTDTASVSRSGTSYTLTVTDSTNPSDSFSTTQTCSGCENESAEWIAERPDYGCCGYSPFADEHAWVASNATQEDVSETSPSPISAGPSPTAITMVGPSGYALSTPAVLNKAGNKFTDTWDNSW